MYACVRIEQVLRSRDVEALFGPRPILKTKRTHTHIMAAGKSPVNHEQSATYDPKSPVS